MSYDGVGELRWSAHAPFTKLGDWFALPDGLTSDGLLNAVELERSNGSSLLDEHTRDHVLNFLETRQHLERYFRDFPGHEPVVERLHRFMRARQRTPAKVLTPEDAVDLAAKTMTALDEMRHGWISRLPPEIAGENVTSLNRYTDRLMDLEIRWVDESTATKSSLVFDGKYVRGRTVRDGLVFTQAEMNGLVDEVAGYIWSDQGFTFADWLDAEDEPRSLEAWDWMYFTMIPLVEQHSSLLDFILSPLYVDRFDGEPYYRLWEGGASMWIGADSIEVRTDWARRWPNSRYVG